MSLLGSDTDHEKTSEWMATSIGVNPVIVRNITGMLRRASLVRTHRGVAGAHAAREYSEISLLDVFKAVEAESDIFAIHPRPSETCPVGSRITGTLQHAFGDVQVAMEGKLSTITMADVLRDLQSRQPNAVR